MRRNVDRDTFNLPSSQASKPLDQTTREAARLQAERIVRLTTALKTGLATT
ncbi:hypothetical protein GCM10017744_003710 [Streptomyces antimycoticus]|uniref:Uncharacterized protein n=1 Tax=Streptomyces antimycoticus TaxID=68175 RepID=A0A4D4KJM8_9ACTN|nr:hypothetical protein SANT12839_095940 [Streptomyces antimycoticus]